MLTLVLSHCLLLVVTTVSFTSRSVFRTTTLKRITGSIRKPLPLTVAILVVCASPLNTREAHAVLLTQATCTDKADSTDLG